MSENKESVDGRRIKDPSTERPSAPGEFAWEFDFTHYDHGAASTDSILVLYIFLPGDQHAHPIHVCRGNAPDSHVWGWDGNFDRPTVTPSIWEKGVWHGYLTAGRFVSCP